jgi:DNA-binding response OmpR family regulator
MRVLNAEGDALTRALRTRILSAAGLEVEEARTGTEATLLACRPGVDLVLLDIQLPGASGFAVCARIKELRPKLPVAFISAVHRTADASRDGFTAGADAFLLDPGEPGRLGRMLRRLHAGSDGAPDVVWLHTDASGTVVALSPAAAVFLHLSERGAIGKNLPNFFVIGRTRLVGDLSRASTGQLVELVSKVRPRDRRLRAVRVDISLVGSASHEPVLQWVIEPLTHDVALLP